MFNESANLGDERVITKTFKFPTKLGGLLNVGKCKVKQRFVEKQVPGPTGQQLIVNGWVDVEFVL